jgi:hypothetical protein
MQDVKAELNKDTERIKKNKKKMETLDVKSSLNLRKKYS